MTLLNMSLGGGVLIAVILVLRRALLHRLPKWTFLLLWGAALCRLLVPFTLPSQLSVYTGAAWIAEAVRPVEETPAPVPVPAPDLPFIIWEDSPDTLREDSWTPPAVPMPSEPRREPLSLLAAVWLTGTVLYGVFFGAAYLWTLRRFWDAVPAEAEFLRRWREEHPTLRPVQVRTCGAVNAPVAYGLIRPVILLPENTNWTDEDQLTYILTHEYVHICRGDLLWKLLLTAALCLHWVNPLVWVMYFRANRDLELACDEAVVRTLGLDSRKGYAYALLSAAESVFSPLCLTYTTKNHMEERIRAIMKMKKKSVAAILAALTLTAGVTAVFATSKAPLDVDKLPSAVQTSQGSAADPSPKPALGDKSNPGDRVHPITQGDTSTPVTPADTSAPDDRVHPVTDQPGDTPTEKSDVCTICTRYYDLPEGHLHPDAKTPNPANCWGIPDGPIAADTEIFAHNEEEFREMIRQLRLMGYNGYVGPITYKCGKYSAVIDAYDGVRRTITPPEGIMPDWTYPVNSKGMTYGNLLMGCHILGYYPDLFSAVATNGAEGYMTAEDALHGQGSRYPVYDLEYENIVGYFETGNQISSEVQEKIDELKNRWNVPADPIPEMTEIRVETEEELKELRQYLTQMRGIREGDMAEGLIRTGGYVILITYEQTEREERLANGYPVNSKGETYGNSRDSSVMGYEPDLIAVQTTSGKGGYAFLKEIRYGDYQGETETLEGRLAFGEWKKTQPSHRLVKVYDADRNNIIGYFPVGNGMANVSDSEELEMIATQLRNWGLSEERVAEELGYYKQIRGMW